ncbi:hypothetical protein [[Flexibacter] sp. ATCC 35208]|uniref:hypothetical protein n=1 Tax=[Flexibacter] sp. ATCC 35208 TaxID=1936242 RepID=UPI0009CC5D33|nr:hypothetical protein [[Flexibacter] sp. ATCC 35208]OMP74706.1 hypothetical protein BW716_33930 [[Flexibacter] sp. ATCC 35208]
MKLLTLFIAFVFSTSALAQDITFRYTDAAGTTSDIPIKPDTKQIVIENAPNLVNFTIIVTNMTANTQLVFSDSHDMPIGAAYLPADVSKAYTAGAALNNLGFKIYLIDASSAKKIFADIAILDKLPAAGINISGALAGWMASVKAVCVPCDESGRTLIYNFVKNDVTPSKQGKRTLWPKVNKPYKFIVKNINPFRDSVIVSSELANYNTDMPALFEQAYFSAGAHGASAHEAQILADVLSLNEQLDAIITALKQARECDDICDFVQKRKDAIEAYFTGQYNFDPSKSNLVSFIAGELQGINDIYKERVTLALNKYKVFINTRNYYSYYIPQVQNVDEYIFTLSILPKKDAQLPVIVDHQPIKVQTVGGWKFDFSTGLFISGLRNESFSLRPDSSIMPDQFGRDSVYNRRNQITRQTDDKPVDFGVAALMHAYPRISSWFNISATLGAALSIGPNPSIRYLGGGSLLLGRNGRFIVTYGCAAGFVEQLSDPYQYNQFTTIGDKSLLTKKVFKTNSFVSVSFNIPLFKSKINTADAGATDSKVSDGDKKQEEKK